LAFTDIELAGHKRVLNAWLEKNRPPPHIRPELDFAYRISGQSVELFEVRPAFQRPKEMMEHSIAKATWNKRQGLWQIYWMRADLNWHRYEPVRSVATLDGFLTIVREDKHACFFG
jgi:Protein of unknown function (DUF3024)